jgi:hypothetical protein
VSIASQDARIDAVIASEAKPSGAERGGSIASLCRNDGVR